MRTLLLLMIGLAMLFGAVDINHAKTKELMTLDGIGKKKARAIMSYRRKHCFESIEEIVKVKGIGEKLLERNRGNITVKECG